jgi:hypothetical protein
MQFTGTHIVRAEDIARAMLLTKRRTEVLLHGFVAVVLIAIFSQVLYALVMYLKAAAGCAPQTLGSSYFA